MKTPSKSITDLKKSLQEAFAVAPADIKINKEFYRKVWEEYSGRNPTSSYSFICNYSNTFKKAWSFANTRESIQNDAKRFLGLLGENYYFLAEKQEWDEVTLFSFNKFMGRIPPDEFNARRDFLKWAAKNAAE